MRWSKSVLCDSADATTIPGNIRQGKSPTPWVAIPNRRGGPSDRSACVRVVRPDGRGDPDRGGGDEMKCVSVWQPWANLIVKGDSRSGGPDRLQEEENQHLARARPGGLVLRESPPSAHPYFLQRPVGSVRRAGQASAEILATMTISPLAGPCEMEYSQRVAKACGQRTGPELGRESRKGCSWDREEIDG